MRRTGAILAALCLVVACADGAGSTTTAAGTARRASSTTSSTPATTTTSSTTTTTLPPTTTTTLVHADGLDAAERTLVEEATIVGDISPKSVISTATGLFFAQNMMYRHTVTVYDRSHTLVETIPDAVTPSEFGRVDFPGDYLGSPVEAAATSDGAHVYVSNYRMYGGGLSTAAGDDCPPGDWPDSLVYRINATTLEIDQLIRVGAVPKFLAVTPDDFYLVVANWCSYDVSLVHLPTETEVARLPVGRYPRGIAFAPDSRTAYVAIMGGTRIARIDLASQTVDYIERVGISPRHLVISPDGRFLYATLNGEGRTVKIDLDSDEVVGSVATGSAPRSMAISDDGTALYIVNYRSDTMSKVRTSDMTETEEHPTGHLPIGITYDAASREVWVSNYSGTIQVFTDTAP